MLAAAGVLLHSAHATRGVEDTDATSLFEQLRETAGPDATTEVKVMAVRSLGAFSDERSLGLILEIAGSFDPIMLSSNSVCASVAEAIGAQLQGRTELSSLSLVVREAEPRLLPVIADGVSRSGANDSIRFLATLLGTGGAAHDDALLDAIRVSIDDRRMHGVDEATLRDLRKYLASPTPELRRAAADCLGRLEDIGSMPALAALLQDEDALVSGSAASALRCIAATDVGNDSELWLAWLAEQQIWWSDEAPAALANLAHKDGGEAHKALASLIEHRLWRHELADAIGPLARRMDRPISSAICAVLGQLGSARAIPHLLSALRVRDDERRACAADALRALTGLDHGTDSAAWSHALEE